MSWLFPSGGQSIEALALASVLPGNGGVKLLERRSTQTFSVWKLEEQVRVGIWVERNTQGEFLQVKFSAETWLCPQEKIQAKTQIACLLANINNVQIKPPTPVELI